MRMHPVRKRLADSGLRHATFKVAVDWLGDLLSGCLYQDAANIEPSGMLFYCLMLRRWVSLVGSNRPWQDTKRKMIAKVRDQIFALRLIWVRRDGLFSHILVKFVLAVVDSNSKSRAGMLKMAMLWTAWEGGYGGSPFGVVAILLSVSIQLLKV
jgi:hypothetical protein